MLAKTLDLTRNHAVVFVDETGHDAFHDDHHPVFGWAGCAMTASEYRRVGMAWEELKRRYFPGVAVMHAADLQRPERRPSREQLAALDRFFREQPFSRFGAVVHKSAPRDFTAVDAMASVTARQIEQVLKHLDFTHVALLYEKSDEWVAKANAMFRAIELPAREPPVVVELGFVSKGAAWPGMEIADFIANAVGGVAREQARADTGPMKALARKDFRAVFSAARKRQSFELVEYARQPTEPRPELPPGHTTMIVRSLGPLRP